MKLRLPSLRLRNPIVPRPVPAPGPRPAPAAELGNGLADPGEVVWAWVPYEEDPTRGKDRPVLVLEVDGEDILTLPMSSVDHDRDADQEAGVGRFWMDVGTGPWDSRGRRSEVRLNRVVRLARGDVRREGAVLDPEVFRRVLEAAARHR